MTQSVLPLDGRRKAMPTEPAPLPGAALDATARTKPTGGQTPRPAPTPLAKRSRSPSPVLDDNWERRIATGALIPEMTIDLHGHTLESAHKRLNQTLATAIARDVRVLLVVTGNPRPPSPVAHGQQARGAIRAEIGDWLALDGHADAIASVRNAHPRHGGKGALYLILRRKK